MYGDSPFSSIIKSLVNWYSNTSFKLSNGDIKPDPHGAPNDTRTWNLTKHVDKSNCYEMALFGTTGKHDQTLAAPGNAAGYFYQIGQLNRDSLIALTEADGRVTGAETHFAGEKLPQSKEGHYIVAAYLAKDSSGKVVDYHYVRRNQDGTWVGKPGTGFPVTYNNFTGKPLSDAPDSIGGIPGIAPSYQKIGYFYVKASGANLGTDVAVNNVLKGTYRQGAEIIGADGRPIASIPNGASIEQAIATMVRAEDSRFMQMNLIYLKQEVPAEFEPRLSSAISAAIDEANKQRQSHER